VTQGRGPYLTESRTLALEQKIAGEVARLEQRIDELEQRVATRVFADVMKAFAQGLGSQLSRMLGDSTTTNGGCPR
jgi:hypothetical protein